MISVYTGYVLLVEATKQLEFNTVLYQKSLELMDIVWGSLTKEEKYIVAGTSFSIWPPVVQTKIDTITKLVDEDKYREAKVILEELFDVLGNTCKDLVYLYSLMDFMEV